MRSSTGLAGVVSMFVESTYSDHTGTGIAKSCIRAGAGHERGWGASNVSAMLQQRPGFRGCCCTG